MYCRVLDLLDQLIEVTNNEFDMTNEGFDTIGDTFDESKRNANASVVADDRDAIAVGELISTNRKLAADGRSVFYADEVDIFAGGKEVYADEMGVSFFNNRSIGKGKVCIAVDPAAKRGMDLFINNGRVDNDTMELL